MARVWGTHRRNGGHDRDGCVITAARWLMTLAAIVLSPIYALWLSGGAICDARDRRRR